MVFAVFEHMSQVVFFIDGCIRGIYHKYCRSNSSTTIFYTMHFSIAAVERMEITFFLETTRYGVKLGLSYDFTRYVYGKSIYHMIVYVSIRCSMPKVASLTGVAPESRLKPMVLNNV